MTSLLQLVKDALDATGLRTLRSFHAGVAWNLDRNGALTHDTEDIARILTDEHILHFDGPHLVRLLDYLFATRGARRLDRTKNQLLLDPEQEQVISRRLEQCRLVNPSPLTLNVGVSLSQPDNPSTDSTLLRVMNSADERYALMQGREKEARYYPLVVPADDINESPKVLSMLEQLNGGALKDPNNSWRLLMSLQEIFLRTWKMVLSYYLGLDFGPGNSTSSHATTLIDSPDTSWFKSEEVEHELRSRTPIKVEQDGDVVIKTEHPDIFELPKQPLYSQTKSRKRKRSPVDILFAPNIGPVVLAPKRIKTEQRDDYMLRVHEKNARVFKESSSGCYQIPDYPPWWPQFMIDRANRLQPLTDLPNGRELNVFETFNRHVFSRTYGSGAQVLDGRWIRKPAAIEDIGRGVGCDFMTAAQPFYNFFLPYAPCSPGFIFKAPGASFPIGTSSKPLEEGEIAPRTVIIPLGVNRWLYVGEYRVRKMGSLHEWKDLPQKFQNLWKSHIYENPALVRDPRLNAHSLCRALDNGTKELEVFSLECIAYHEEIQRAVVEKLPHRRGNDAYGKRRTRHSPSVV